MEREATGPPPRGLCAVGCPLGERQIGLLLAIVDDFSPTAVEEHRDAVRVFFSRSADREAARRALAERFSVAVVDVPDEDWARRSQQHLQPVTIGRLTLVPDPHFAISNLHAAIVIPASMGFGTGHHATTRLCLEALQIVDLADRAVLDVGTGSGVLAIAAVRLGAARAVGIDVDADAIHAARENLTHNPDVSDKVLFGVQDVFSLRSASVPGPTSVPWLGTEVGGADVVTANLTGAMLVRAAPVLLAALRPGGTLIVSGLQIDEREEVGRALAATRTVWDRTADEWVGLMVKKS